MKCNDKRPHYKYNKTLAQKICKKMGIKWSDTALSPTLHGVSIPGEYFGDIFRGNTVSAQFGSDEIEGTK